MSYKKSVINSIVAFLILCANPIAWLGSGGVIPLLCISSLVLLIVVNHKFPISIMILGLLIGLAFCISSCLPENIDNPFFRKYLLTFFSLGVTAFLCSQMPIDETLIIKVISIFSILFIPFLLNIDMGNIEIDSIDYGKWMGISYGTLRLLNSLVVILFFSKYNKSWLLALAGGICYFLYLFIYGSRGALFAVGVMLLLLIAIRNNYSFLKSCRLCLIPLGFIIIFFEEILLLILKTSSLLGLHVNFAEKMQGMLYSGESLSNGRDHLIEYALNGILDSPIIGNGIATFEPYNSGYVHNVFFQIFYELGVVPLVCFLIILGASVRYIFNREHNLKYRIFMAYLMSSGIVELCFSSSMWLSQIFWFYIGYVLKTCFKSNEKTKDPYPTI